MNELDDRKMSKTGPIQFTQPGFRRHWRNLSPEKKAELIAKKQAAAQTPAETGPSLLETATEWYRSQDDPVAVEALAEADADTTEPSPEELEALESDGQLSAEDGARFQTAADEFGEDVAHAARLRAMDPEAFDSIFSKLEKAKSFGAETSAVDAAAKKFQLRDPRELSTDDRRRCEQYRQAMLHYVEQRDLDMVKLCYQMEQTEMGFTDKRALFILLDAAGRARDTSTIDAAIAELTRCGQELDGDICSLLVKASALQGDLSRCQEILKGMVNADMKIRPAAFHAVISTALHQGQEQLAFRMYNYMKRLHVEPTAPLFQSMFQQLFASKSYEAAYYVMQTMVNTHTVRPGSGLWSMIICGFAEANAVRDMQDAMRHMRQKRYGGVQPSATAWTAAFNRYVL